MFAGRNGESDKGWAVRLYGSHSDKTFNGTIHNNVQNNFFINWESNCTIGLLYNAGAKTLSYFHNKTYIGTPFTNVEGAALYFLAEGCHLGAYNIVENVELPSEE